MFNYSIKKIKNAAFSLYDEPMQQILEEYILRKLADKLIEIDKIQHNLGDIMNCNIEQLKNLINNLYKENEILYYINCLLEKIYTEKVYKYDLLKIKDIILKEYH